MPLDSDWLFHRNVPANHEKNTKDISDSAPPLDFDWLFGNFKGEKIYFMLTGGIELETYCL
jgi:hypothetical protein